MKTNDQIALRMYIRAREDFQSMRKRMDNRLSRKADGTSQKIQDERSFSLEDLKNFDELAKQARIQEKVVEKMLRKHLKHFPVYKEFLKDVKGVGEIAAGWILGEFDIEIATTVVRGKKRVSKSKYKPSMGEIIAKIPDSDKNNEIVDYIILTTEMIKGDRPTEGFILPYNKKLRATLLGILADGFIKAKSPYALNYYYPYKERLENEQSIVNTHGRTRKDAGKSWKDVSKGHRDRAAKRYMIKMFLKDVYVAWRTIENLPVRPSYAEEYLGKAHSIKITKTKLNKAS
jgi:hypothetical protein